MRRFFERLDTLAGIGQESGLVTWLERIAFVFLVLMVLAAPHSIAATQTAWIAGMFLWVVSVGVAKFAGRPHEQNHPVRRGGGHPSFVRRGVLDAALWAFFLWSVVTSFTSYAPDISIDKLRGAAVFLIFYFVACNLRTLRAVYFAAFALILSCMINVLWTPVQRLVGRGVEIHGLAADGPLAKALLIAGDTLLTANGRKVSTPEEVVEAIRQNESTKIKFYRPDFEYTVEVKRDDLLPGGDAMQQLGIQSWKKSRNWRSRGFYGHYTTYAEVLQLIASLVFGLFIASVLGRGKSRIEPPRRRDAESEPPAVAGGAVDFGMRNAECGMRNPIQNPKSKIQNRRTRSLSLPVLTRVSTSLFVGLGLMSLALLLTVTRASQLGLLVSAFAVVAAAGSRKLFLGLAAVALPVVIGALVFLQQSRNVGFLDAKDDSTIYRQTMWRDGVRLWTESPRNFVLGVGMDSIQRYWREWGLFDGGKMPMGHFHSTPIQLLVERGLPALILWLAILGVYARIIWKGLKNSSPKSKIQNPKSTSLWVSRGILLGCLGGMTGFFTSGLVHYNLGDQEVAMMFFLLMALAVRTAELAEYPVDDRSLNEAAAEYRMAA